MALQGRDADPALGLRFEVKVDSQDLGYFTTCDGLGAEYEVMEYTEGGENTYVHKLPGRMKYTAIKLSRAVDANTSKIAAWFTSMRQGVKRGTAVITVYDGNKKAIAEWKLDGVFPLRWTGPSLSADGNQVAKETLELAHNGFMP